MVWYGEVEFCQFCSRADRGPDTVEDKLQELLSESNQQQQDLNRTLNGLSSLKLGYALLQQYKLNASKNYNC